ncbi:tyrosine-type recombinase/integrase [Sedimentibacter sp.]|uniref:tyrosine-type recombinase/integrase n=1 Tax=Sedimentibacter sp. TaxID=1960295 RepID=UPI00289F9A1C|nr:tyrosine-type recombinase/integrase [Sedimentibacter sp.]
MKLSQLKDMFIIDNEIKGNSKKTIAQYKRVLGYFIDFTADIDADLLTIDIIKSYQKNLLERQFIGNSFYSGKDGQKLSRTTVNTYMTHLRTFVIYLYDNQYIDANLFDKITIVKKPKIIKEILSDYEIEKVLMSFSNCEMSVRNQCIFLSMVDAGLRLSEICNLDVPDVIFNGNMIKINGAKGFKDRYVPMSLSLKKSLYKYITMYRVPDFIDNKALFLSKDKKRITEKAVTMVIVRLRKKMKFDKMNPHRLRHTFATNYIINGGDMFNLQLILGHEDIQTVRKYVHLARYYLQSSYTNISVCDRLSKNNSKIKI